MRSGPSQQSPGTYRIAELSRELGVTQRALRHYEQVGLLSPQRWGSERIYSSLDRARVILILGGRAMGMTLGALGRLFELYEREGSATEMAQALGAFRQQIRFLKTRRDEVGQAIAILQAETERLSRADPDRSAAEGPGAQTVRRAGRYATA